MKRIFILSLVLLLLINVVNAQSESPNVKITLLNQNPDPARAAEIVELRFMIENIGDGQAENVELEIVPEYPFSLVEGYEALQNIGTLYAYQQEKNSLTLRYKLRIDKDAVKGQHVLKLRSRYDNQVWGTVSYNVEVTSKEFAQIIYLDKAKLDPGKETEMTFTITNIGNAPLQNMIFSWSEANGIILPVFSDDTKYVKYLDVGDSAELLYTVVADVNAQPGLYQLDLTLKYESLETEGTEINTKAGVFVGGETDFEVSFSESSQGQTSLSVANTGNNPALSVSVKIPEQNNFRVIGSTSSIIGNLDKGDYTIVSFQIAPRGSFGDTAANREGQRQRPQWGQDQGHNVGNGGERFSGGSNNLDVVIEYTDTTGERRSIEKTVPIQFRAGGGEGAAGQGQFGAGRQQQTSFFKNKGILITVLVVVLGLGFYFYRKKEYRAKMLNLVKRKK
ncbi:MAG: hypothetical protein IIB81_00945 [Nanoarchaeota archaeon]|nr:hypothetical protein [Nanoarchaeota archaeon]